MMLTEVSFAKTHGLNFIWNLTCQKFSDSHASRLRSCGNVEQELAKQIRAGNN